MAHGHPSFRQSMAPGDPLKTLVIKFIMEKPVCESVIPTSRLEVGKVDGKCQLPYRLYNPLQTQRFSESLVGASVAIRKFVEGKKKMRRGGDIGLLGFDVQCNEQIRSHHE